MKYSLSKVAIIFHLLMSDIIITSILIGTTRTNLTSSHVGLGTAALSAANLLVLGIT